MPLDLSHLNPKQRQFVELVARGSYISAAYADAGFVANSSSATQLAAKLSKEIQAKVEEIVAERFKDAPKLTPMMVISGLLDLATKGAKESTRVAAWTQLGRTLGMFVDKLETTDAVELRKLLEAEGIDADEAIREAERLLS